MNGASTERTLVVHCTGPQPIMPSTVGEAEVHLHYASLADHDHELTDLSRLLDPVERARADRFRFAVDHDRFIIAHGLLRRLLGTALDMDPGSIRFGRGAFGKPYVEGSELQFNLSDTKDALVIGISHQGPIGVDLETMTRTVDHTAVGEHYFSSSEVEGIASAEDPKRRFLELWTRKEAVLKACGVGIMEDLRVLRVDAPLNSMTIRHDAFIQLAAPEYHVRTWHLGETHVISLAEEHQPSRAALIMA